MGDFFKNIPVSLRATSPTAAVVAVWFIGIVALGMFGNAALAERVTGNEVARGSL